MFLDRWARWVESWARPVARVMSTIGVVALLLMMFWIVADVTMRFLFNSPILGSFEIVEYGLVFFVFLAFGFAQFHRSHINVSLLVDQLGPRARAAADVLTGLVMIALLSLMVWASVVQTESLFRSHVTSAVLLIPKWPFELVTAIGLAAFVVAKLVDVLESLAVALGKVTAEKPAEDTGETITF